VVAGTEQGVVTVRGSAQGFAQEITAGASLVSGFCPAFLDEVTHSRLASTGYVVSIIVSIGTGLAP
jgi:hypothetical protein